LISGLAGEPPVAVAPARVLVGPSAYMVGGGSFSRMAGKTKKPVVELSQLSGRLVYERRRSLRMPNHANDCPSIDALTDERLSELATNGDPKALQLLLMRQQTWIYNFLLYMLHSRHDAEDATQEVLVKVATGLSSFKRECSFRTWARKIAVNHALDFRRSRPEQVVTGFGCYADYLERAPDTDIIATHGDSPETALLVDEARTSCVMGMLLCLDREQRITFLLGEILETGDVLGAELMGVTRENFRQRLCRAREQLGSFMHGRCGLVNPSNPCRCARKTGAFIRDGIVDPDRIQFAKRHLNAIVLDADRRNQRFEGLLARTQAELRELYPLFEAPDVAARLSSLLEGQELKALLNLN
jgi:RNA polymerase sigma factor (sigma-70 family)